MVSDFAGIAPGKVKVAIDCYKKPYLPLHPDIHFNLSYSDAYIACAVSDVPVGVDIEVMKPRSMKIAHRFFTPYELAYITAIEAEKLVRFYEIWTKKESAIKMWGTGFLTSISSFDVLKQSSIGYTRISSNFELMCHVCIGRQIRFNF